MQKILEECSKVDRVELIKRPRKNKRAGGGPKKYVLCSRWDPRQANVRQGLKMMEEILYHNKENEKVFPRGSIIAGFRRQRNLGEIIAPTKPQRVAVERTDGGCFPCDAARSCTLHQSGALQQTNSIIIGAKSFLLSGNAAKCLENFGQKFKFLWFQDHYKC